MAPLTFRKLRIWNACIGVAQLFSGVAILALTDYGSKARLPFYTFFIGSWSRESDNGAQFYVPVSKQVANFPLGVWSGVFLLLSAINHFLTTLPGINGYYNRRICENRNPFRWAEYSISASLMSVMIGQLCGITDIHLLFTLFALMGSTMLFGHLMETSNGTRITTYAYTADARTPPEPLASPKDAPPPSAFISEPYGAAPLPGHPSSNGHGGERAASVDWTPFLFGCWPFLAAMLVTACFFFQAVSRGDPPTFVWSLFFILFFLYLLFAVNQVLQFKQVRGWRGFARAEWFYMLLSLTSKQLLAWITYGGTKRFE